MCFNITFKGFNLSCCTNGTFDAVNGVWSDVRSPRCLGDDEILQESEDFNPFLILIIIIGVLVILRFLAFMLLFAVPGREQDRN